MTLGSTDDEQLLDPNTTLARDSRGRWFALAIGRRAIVVFSPDGKYSRAIGRAGDGPGEFQRPIMRLLVAAGDSILAVEGGGRVTVLSPALSVARVTVLPLAPRAVDLASGDLLIVNGAIGTADRVGWPMHSITPAGAVVRSFGAQVPRAQPGASMTRSIAVSSARDAVWTGQPTQEFLDLQLWGLDGTVRARVRLPRDTLGAGVLLRQDTAGRLWIGESFTLDTFPVVRNPPQRGTVFLERQQVDFIHVRQAIRVVDPVRGLLLATAILENALAFLPGSDLAYTAQYGADRIIHIAVFVASIAGE
jgi:6-bladed beta-propeller